MVLYITKKGGEREPFQPEKIVESCKKAGAGEELGKKIAEEVSTIAYVQMPTEEIRAEVINLLKRFNPEAAKNYIEYGKKED